MNQTQIKYARQRIEEIYSSKLKKVKEEYTVPAVQLTLEEKIEAIKAGEYEIPNPTGYGDNNLQRLKFSVETFAHLSDGYKEEAEKLSTRKTELLDNLILGDSKEIFDMINEFEKEDI